MQTTRSQRRVSIPFMSPDASRAIEGPGSRSDEGTNVVLFSSGLDSYIAHYLLNRPAVGGRWQPIYFDLGTRYARKEMRVLDTFPFPVRIWTVSHLGWLEHADSFLPQRNPLLLTMAQAFHNADAIALCAVRGEYSRDKHKEFFARMSRLLSYTAGKQVKCFSPLLGLTKTQAVRRYLEEGGSPGELLDTVSCYHATSSACGACMSCARRWVALENNEIAQEWDSPPWDWLRHHRQPISTLRGLPKLELPNFLWAQIEVVRAYRALGKRL